MPRKCCVFNCKTNYMSGSKDICYSFPKDKVEQIKWIRKIPNKIDKLTKTIGVCRKHWPHNTFMYKPHRSRHLIPRDPPSIFDCPALCSSQTVSCEHR